MATLEEEKEEFLKHYGVKGMKWGKRLASGGRKVFDKTLSVTRPGGDVDTMVKNRAAQRAKFNKKADRGDKAISKSGGSANKAIAKRGAIQVASILSALVAVPAVVGKITTNDNIRLAADIASLVGATTVTSIAASQINNIKTAEVRRIESES